LTPLSQEKICIDRGQESRELVARLISGHPAESWFCPDNSQARSASEEVHSSPSLVLFEVARYRHQIVLKAETGRDSLSSPGRGERW
jgi:hypothetical protein